MDDTPGPTEQESPASTSTAAALDAVARMINALLRLDPDTQSRFAALHGHSIRIEFRGLSFAVNFVPAADGSVTLPVTLDKPPDCVISGSPVDLLRARDSDTGKSQLFAGRVTINGDSGVAQGFSDAIAGLDLDWEEALSWLLGDTAAHQLGQAARSAGKAGAAFSDRSSDLLATYLTEEARLLPHHLEIEQFGDETDLLRDDVDRLAARIALLEQGTDETAT